MEQCTCSGRQKKKIMVRAVVQRPRHCPWLALGRRAAPPGSGAAGPPPHRPAPVHSAVWETWLFSGPGAGCREPVLSARLQGNCDLPLCGAQFSKCIHFPEYLPLVASSAGKCVDWFKGCPQSRAHPNLGSCLGSSVSALFKTQCIFCETSHCSCRLLRRLEMLKILLLLNFRSMLEHLQVPLNLVFKKLSNLYLSRRRHLPPCSSIVPE